MDPRWFKEDRKLPKEDQQEAIRESEKALKNSTLLSRRLKEICKDEIERTYRVEEEVEHPAYERLIISAASRRRAFKEVIKLLP